MPNLFIKTNYWTRAQKPWLTLYVNLFCEEGKPGKVPSSCHVEWWACRYTHRCGPVVSCSSQLRRKGVSVGCHVACPLGLIWQRGRLDPWTYAAVLV